MTEQLAQILKGRSGRRQMLEGYERMRSQLTESNAPARGAAIILADLHSA
jgi:hypothetical protein